MKIALLHLSDLHINKDNSKWLQDKAQQIVSAVRKDFAECRKIIIVVTGDIADAGKEEQYGYAKQFFRALLRSFAEHNPRNAELVNKIICVPGNHDCNFDHEDTARNMLLEGMRTDLSKVDESVYEMISAVQNEYKAFAKEIMIDKNFRLAVNNDISIDADDKTILFHLYNTSWMSVRKEIANSILMPMSMMSQERTDAIFSISLFHHHYDWITPGCDNNKNQFRKHIMQTSNMAIYGHEHTPFNVLSIYRYLNAKCLIKF